MMVRGREALVSAWWWSYGFSVMVLGVGVAIGVPFLGDNRGQSYAWSPITFFRWYTLRKRSRGPAS